MCHIGFKIVLIRIQFPIKESAVEIEHVNVPVISGGNSKNGSDGSKFGDRSKCVIVINTVNLSEALGNKPGLVMLELLFNFSTRRRDG